MFFINFAFPMLLLMSREAKRHSGLLTFVGVIILVGHWLDTYIMISAGSMGAQAQIGFLEIGMAIAFAGFFIRSDNGPLATSSVKSLFAIKSKK